jgi:hypothetical protein
MYSIGQSSRMNLPLQLNQSESASTALEHVVPDTNKPEDYALDERTKISFLPEDVSKNLSKPSVGIRFELSDTEQLELFCGKRLEFVSKKVLEIITSCWYERKELQHIPKPCVMNGLRARLRRLGKDGKYQQSAIFTCYSLYPAIVSQAVSLLLQGGATEHEEPKLHDSWIIDLEIHTRPVVDKIAASQFSRKVGTKTFVQSNVLPSLFHVAKLYEDLCQPMNNDSPSKHEIFIEWSQYLISRKQRVTREDTADSELPQRKRQCVRKASKTQYGSTVHGPSDSSTPVHTSAISYPFQASLGPHQPQKPGWERIKQNTFDCPYEVPFDYFHEVSSDYPHEVPQCPARTPRTDEQPKHQRRRSVTPSGAASAITLGSEYTKKDTMQGVSQDDMVATTHLLPQRKRPCTQAISSATISARSMSVHSSALSNTPRGEEISAMDIYNVRQDPLLTAFHLYPEAGQMWNGPAPFLLHTTPLAFHPRIGSMTLSKYVEDPISRMSETPDDKIFIHYNIPTIPVSENCNSNQSLKPLPDNAAVSDIWQRLDLDNDTHNWLLVRVSSSVQHSFINIIDSDTQMKQETLRISSRLAHGPRYQPQRKTNWF